MEDTLQFIVDRYKLDLDQPNPIKVPVSRWHDLGHMLNDLGFKKAVELGVYKGKYTQTIATRAPNMELIGVDAWTTYDGYLDYLPGDLETVGYPQAVARTSQYPNVKLVRGWSKDVAPTIPDGSLDYLFIDANHTYECCKEDIALWAPKVREGGIVMGHDYFDTNNHRRLKHLNFGVIRAVNEWVEGQGIKHLFLTADGYPAWFYVQGDI